jgi:hypothetical protein
MELKVRLILDGNVIPPSEYQNVMIASPMVDKIVNHVYETYGENPSQDEA